MKPVSEQSRGEIFFSFFYFDKSIEANSHNFSPIFLAYEAIYQII
jgi:hypothetical protein